MDSKIQKMGINSKAKRCRRTSGNGRRRSSLNPEKDAVMKVVYISTPMKVKTSASKFRATVQELTGRESDVVGIMESSGGRDTWMVPDHHDYQCQYQHGDDDHHNDGVIMIPSFLEQEAPDIVRSSPDMSSEGLIHDSNFNGVLDFKGHEGFEYCPFGNSSSLLFDQLRHQFDLVGGY